jgi:hypothetical protein
MNSVTNSTEDTLVKGYLTGYCWLHHQVDQALSIEHISGKIADIHLK